MPAAATVTSAAEASTASYDNGVLTITAADAGGHVAVINTGTQALISTSSGDTMPQPAGCSSGGVNIWTCPAPSSIVFNGSEAADSFSNLASPWPATVYGNGGNDSLVAGGDGDDTVSGGAGDDANVQGGPGADTVDGGDGNDTVYGDNGQGGCLPGDGPDGVTGGDGSDLLYPQGGAGNVVGGGAGADTVTYGSYLGSQPLTVSLDGSADDGPAGAPAAPRAAAPEAEAAPEATAPRARGPSR